jgi:cytochrome c biogenesis protein CcmG/thiol:disulfide interchange protein DsbE
VSTETARAFNPRVLLVGLGVVAPLVAILVMNLGRDPHVIGSPLVGRPAPDFTLQPMGGGAPVTLASLRGQPVVLNFWATWCVPCFEEHPVLVGAARRLARRSASSASSTRTARRGHVLPGAAGLVLPVARGSRQPHGDRVRRVRVPETYFIDSEGRIAAKHVGPLDDETLALKLAQAGVTP